jgi:hypothetical protein
MPLSSKTVELSLSQRKRILYRDLGVFRFGVLRGWSIDDNFVVRRDRNPNMDLKTRPVTMLMARRDDRYAATRDVPIVGF